MQVSIIIVNYNTEQHLYECLKSINDFTFELELEIIVVDNGSKDNSIEMLKDCFPEVRLIESNKNLGFGKANNLGVQNAKGEFVFLLNSDTLLTENSIKILYDFFLEKEIELSIGVLGCELIDEKGQTANSGGGFPWVINDIKEYYYLIAEKLFSKKFEPRDTYDFKRAFFEIDYVIGADMFLRKNLYTEIGGFDQAYFMYYEEADLQMQIRNKGYKCYVITTTRIIHLEGGSTKRVKFSQKKRLMNQKSRNYYFKKNDRKDYPLYIATDFIINISRLFNRNYSFKENVDFIIKNIKSY